MVQIILYGTNNILTAIVILFCSNSFHSFSCDGKSMSFQLYWLIKGLIFDILCWSLSIFWWFKATVKAYWKQLSPFLFSGFAVALLFFNHSGESTYYPPLLKLALWRWYHKSILSQTKSLPFIFSSNPSWYISKRDSQSSLIISSFITYHNLYVINLCAYCTDFFRTFRRKKTDLHC